MDTATTQDRKSAELEIVTFRALREGPPYKEASGWRQAPAVVIDMLLHLLAGLIVAGLTGAESWSFFVTLVTAYVVASFVHRVLLRRWWGVTIGGGLFGLRWVESGTGRRPTLGWFAWAWLIGSLVTVLTVLTGG
ncbi:RDD family protein [Amycolatopsis sp. NBC_01307]|uniref:RDD family protein n=1 Tax=Amycolatopsis sp. NBC_01307 TaxID=2903561 RepID=UPI002E153DAD|nr:RDD family protein [Amycolatopsis sp. NBC_01307]